MKQVSIKEWLEFVLLFNNIYNAEQDITTLTQNAPGYGVVAKVNYLFAGDKTFWIDESKHPSAVIKPEPEAIACDRKPEPYVWLSKTAIALGSDNEYHRPAGNWSIGWNWKDGKQLSVSGNHNTKHLDGIPLLPCTREDFLKDNQGYVGDGSNYP